MHVWGDDGCHTIWHIPEEVGWCSTVHAHFAWTMTCFEGGCSGRMGVWTEVDAGLDYAWSSGNGAFFVWTEVAVSPLAVSLLMFNDCCNWIWLGKICDILLLDNQLAKFVIEHEKDKLHIKQRTTIIVHTRSAMIIQHCINPPNFTKQALLFINGAQIIGIH